VRASAWGALLGLYVGLLFLALCLYAYATLWFTFFDSGPRGQGDEAQSAQDYEENRFISRYQGLLLVAMGIFSAYVAFVLFSMLQLTKKVLRRMLLLPAFQQL